MGVYKREGSDFYYTKFKLGGEVVRKCTKTTSFKEAEAFERELRVILERNRAASSRASTKERAGTLEDLLEAEGDGFEGGRQQPELVKVISPRWGAAAVLARR